MSLKSAQLIFSSAYIEVFNGAKHQPYKLVVSRDFEIRKQIVYEFNHGSHYRFIRFNVFHDFKSSTWMNLASKPTLYDLNMTLPKF